jgi:hypothetical protein
MLEAWVISSVVASIGLALMSLFNEYFRLNPIHLVFWLRIFVCAALIPVIAQLSPPLSLAFYIATLISVFCFSYFDFIFYSQAIKSGAGMITRFEGLVVGVTFFLWLIIEPSVVASYFENPVRGAGILASLAGSIYFALRMKGCSITVHALKEMGPALILSGIGVTCGKIAMDNSDFHSGVWYYAFIQSFLSLLLYISVLHSPPLSRYFKISGRRYSSERRILLGAIGLSIIWFMNVIFKYYAIAEVENPAYVTIIGLTSPFWVLLVYFLVGRSESANVKAGLGLVICAIMLVAFAHL